MQLRDQFMQLADQDVQLVVLKRFSSIATHKPRVLPFWWNLSPTKKEIHHDNEENTYEKTTRTFTLKI